MTVEVKCEQCGKTAFLATEEDATNWTINHAAAHDEVA